jgi:GGDEF domain-containing protein
MLYLENKRQEDNSNNSFKLDNLMYLYLEGSREYVPEEIRKYDALILEAKEEEQARRLLVNIRSSDEKNIYLKPVFLMNAKEIKDPLLSKLTDGVIYSFRTIHETTRQVHDLLKRIETISEITETGFEAKTIKKALNFEVSRLHDALRPVPDTRFSLGFSYPALSVQFTSGNDPVALDVLEWAEDQNLIQSDFYEKIHLCSSCHGGILIYREVCPYCSSSNTYNEDLVHHFPCAYIGPMSDFRKPDTDELVCPKCTKKLKHIGQDYDKPSVVNHCKNCNKSFQDTTVKARCLTCNTDNSIEYLIPKTLKTYRLSKKAENVSRNEGSLTDLPVKSKDPILGTVDLDTFHIMLHYDIERMKHSPQTKSNLSAIYMENLEDVYEKSGVFFHDTLMTDIIRIVRENIRPSDFITIKDQKIIVLTINDMSVEKAEEVIQKLIDIIKNIIRSNVDNIDLTVSSKTVELHTKSSAKEQIQSLLRTLFEK